MVTGFIYYHPAVLGKPWMKAAGLSPERLKKEQKQMGKLYGVSFVAAVITAYVLTHVVAMSVSYYQYPVQVAAASSAFFSWLGFIMPVQLTDQIFGAKNWKLLVINTAYQLIALIIMGQVIAMF